jgi:hypothetical protein
VQLFAGRPVLLSLDTAIANEAPHLLRAPRGVVSFEPLVDNDPLCFSARLEVIFRIVRPSDDRCGWSEQPA